MSGIASEQSAVQCAALASGYTNSIAALQEVSFSIRYGERVGIIGPNGAGKSTLLRCLVGVQPFSGTLLIDGFTVDKPNMRDVRLRMGLVFQNPDDQLFSSTVRDDVAFGPLAMGMPPESVDRRVTEALRSVGLEYAADRNPVQLSFGERRLAAIASVLSMRPRILAMDEPSSNLDPLHRRRLIDWLNLQEDLTLLLVSHDLDMVAECCDRVLLLNTTIIADAAAHTMLTDATLLHRHDLELPLGLQRLSFRSVS
ncbi:MAG: energy-coupling factor ABC transporter ATP-binding protein [Bacteroidia bacterium]|nr:energy-coupling factor ABC transporter ATP-binding protein [Bacteroidia bacterium]